MRPKSDFESFTSGASEAGPKIYKSPQAQAGHCSGELRIDAGVIRPNADALGPPPLRIASRAPSGILGLQGGDGVCGFIRQRPCGELYGARFAEGLPRSAREPRHLSRDRPYWASPKGYMWTIGSTVGELHEGGLRVFSTLPKREFFFSIMKDPNARAKTFSHAHRSPRARRRGIGARGATG